MTAEQPSQAEQATLAERVRTRDPAAENALVRLYGERILVMLIARVQDREAARDLAQDTLLAVVKALRSGHLREGEKLSAYICGIARNVANNYLRQRGQRPEVLPLDPEQVPFRATQGFEDFEQLDLVRRALVRLDLLDRRILLLTLVEGLKPGEIAQQVGLTSEVVRARKSRAVKKVSETVRQLSRRSSWHH